MRRNYKAIASFDIFPRQSIGGEEVLRVGDGVTMESRWRLFRSENLNVRQSSNSLREDPHPSKSEGENNFSRCVHSGFECQTRDLDLV